MYEVEEQLLPTEIKPSFWQRNSWWILTLVFISLGVILTIIFIVL